MAPALILGTVGNARGAVALYTAQLARSRNALQLLVGAALAAEALPPAGWLQAPAQAVWPALPQALPSSVLLARPDVQAAEHALIAQHAHIGAARAAFFPTISLTASTGSSRDSIKAWRNFIARAPTGREKRGAGRAGNGTFCMASAKAAMTGSSLAGALAGHQPLGDLVFVVVVQRDQRDVDAELL